MQVRKGASGGGAVPVLDCLGYEQLSVTAGAVVEVDVPAGATKCIMQAGGDTMRFTLDGDTEPTAAAIGQILWASAAANDNTMILEGIDFSNLKIIAIGGGGYLAIHFFG